MQLAEDLGTTRSAGDVAAKLAVAFDVRGDELRLAKASRLEFPDVSVDASEERRVPK
jgi:hypothetical protein